jgi:uncharacterized membrane protein
MPGWVGVAAARSAIYLYFSVGASLLANGLIFAIWLDYGGSDKNFPPVVGAITFFAILLVLVSSGRAAFGRSISLRKWIPLCLVSTLGLLPLVLFFGMRTVTTQ